MLYRSDIGKSALKNKSLLLDVVKHKQIFYNSSYAKYDQCLAGKFNLIPRGEHLQSLIADYENMIDSKMFYEKPMLFEEIIKDLEQMELDLKEMP